MICFPALSQAVSCLETGRGFILFHPWHPVHTSAHHRGWEQDSSWSTKSSGEVVVRARGGSQGSGGPAQGVTGPTYVETAFGAEDKVGLSVWERGVHERSGKISRQRSSESCLGDREGNVGGKGIPRKVSGLVQRHRVLTRILPPPGRRELVSAGGVRRQGRAASESHTQRKKAL